MKTKTEVLTAAGKRITVTCLDCPEKLEIYAPPDGDKNDTIYEIGGVVGNRWEWARLFKRIGIR